LDEDQIISQIGAKMFTLVQEDQEFSSDESEESESSLPYSDD